MSKLFETWSWNRPHIHPFSGYAKALLRRSDVSTQYFAGSARKATVHPLIMQAVQMYLDLELGNRASGHTHEGAIGSQGNDITVAEYPSSSGELQIIIFNRNTGKFMAGRYPDPITPTARPTAYSYAEAGNSGTALFFALLPTFLGNPEFNQAYQDYKAQATAGFPDDDATSKAAALMCDNMYRRIEYASGLGADGVNVVIPAGGAIPALRTLDIKRGTYLPTNTLAGQFEIMVDTNTTGSPKATIAINDFVGKYVLDESRVSFFCELGIESVRIHICFIHVSFHLSYNDLFINSTKPFLTIKKEWTKHTRSYPFLSLWQIRQNKKRHKLPSGQSTALIYNHKQPMLG